MKPWCTILAYLNIFFSCGIISHKWAHPPTKLSYDDTLKILFSVWQHFMYPVTLQEENQGSSHPVEQKPILVPHHKDSWESFYFFFILLLWNLQLHSVNHVIRGSIFFVLVVQVNVLTVIFLPSAKNQNKTASTWLMVVFNLTHTPLLPFQHCFFSLLNIFYENYSIKLMVSMQQR